MAETRKLGPFLRRMQPATASSPVPTRIGRLRDLRALWSDLTAPTIAMHHCRVVKRTGDGSIIEFRSVVDACGAPSRCRTAWSRFGVDAVKILVAFGP